MFVKRIKNKSQTPNFWYIYLWFCTFSQSALNFLWVNSESGMTLPVIWASQRLCPSLRWTEKHHSSLWLSQRFADDTCTCPLSLLCAHSLKVMLIRFSSGCSSQDPHLHTMKSCEQKHVLEVTAEAASHSLHWFTTKESDAFSKTVTLFFIPALHVCRLGRRTSHMEQMDES